jgi:hypothetical protein
MSPPVQAERPSLGPRGFQHVSDAPFDDLNSFCKSRRDQEAGKVCVTCTVVSLFWYYRYYLLTRRFRGPEMFIVDFGFSPRRRLHRIAAKSGRSRILPSASAGCVGRSLRYGTYLACGMPIKGGDRPRRLNVGPIYQQDGSSDQPSPRSLLDSLLEGGGFELPVPPKKKSRSGACRRGFRAFNLASSHHPACPQRAKRCRGSRAATTSSPMSEPRNKPTRP